MAQLVSLGGIEFDFGVLGVTNPSFHLHVWKKVYPEKLPWKDNEAVVTVFRGKVAHL